MFVVLKERRLSMNNKTNKRLGLLMMITMLLVMTGCASNSQVDYSGSNKSITVNCLNMNFTTKDVEFNDVMNNVYIKLADSTYVANSNSLNSNFISFVDKGGVARCAHVSTPLSELPSEFKLYKDANDSKYDKYIKK